MKQQTKQTPVVAGLCAEWREDDGFDPRLESSHEDNRCDDKHLRQVCKQAQRVISRLLLEVSTPICLNTVFVSSVDSEQHGQQLCVTVAHASRAFACDSAEVVQALQELQGAIRSELAHSLHRRRTPQLRFCYGGVLEQGGV
ncbi:MAG: ribosome-binding factor A [Gammaproteobacteria bacterium]|nr:ribosome-binding factor A [Gammaproteobacteria bacterium]